MADDTQAAQQHREEMMRLYPSLRKIEEMGDAYVEFDDGREERLLEFLQDHPRSSEFKEDPTLILNAMDEFSRQHDFLINVGEHKAGVLAKLIAQEKLSTIVELGGYMGYSAILFVVEMRKAAAGRPFHVWSLEYEPRFAVLMRSIFELAGIQDDITVLVGSGADSLRKLRESGKIEHIDVLFLDHIEDLYLPDFEVAMKLGLLKSGSCIIADNAVRPGAPDYVKYVRNHQGLKSEGVRGLITPGNFEDELEVTKVL